MLALLLVATPIVQLHVQGEFLDPPEVIERVVRAEAGNDYVAENPTPTEEAPAGTQQRLTKALRELGYEAAFAAKPVSGGIDLTVILKPIPRIRQIIVRPVFGKFPLFEEDILRRIRFRPGQPLPPPEERERQFEEQKARIRMYLEREGYFDGQVEFFVKPRSRPEEVDLEVVLYKGQGYTLDGNNPLVWFDAQSDRLALQPPDIRRFFHHDSFWQRLTCLWVCREFSADKLRDDKQSLIGTYHEKGFPGARVSDDFSTERSLDRARKKVVFTVSISTRKKVEVQFRGNHHINDDDLYKVLTFNDAGSYDSFECQNSADAIHHAYQKDGYYEVKVTFERKEPTDKLVRVTFTVEEGPELKVRGLQFVGNDHFTAAQLAGAIQTKPWPAIGAIGLGEGGYLTNKQLEGDEKRIQEFYRKHGFPNAEVEGDVASDPNLFEATGAMAASLEAMQGRTDGDLYVRFTINEGPLVTVASIDVTYAGPDGNPTNDHKTSKADALRYIRLRKGSPLTDEAVKADRDAVRRWLRNSGYAKAEVKVKEPKEDEGATEKHMIFEIAEGRMFQFGETLLRGNFVTVPRVILRELPWKPGDHYDDSKVEDAERNLRLLGLFTTIRISFDEAAADAGVLHTIVQVEERYDGIDLEGAGGYATDALAYATLKVGYHNLFGWGKGVELSGTIGQRRDEATATYIDPRLIGSRFRLEYTLFLRSEDTVRLGQIRTIGSTLTVSREILPKLRAYMRYEVKQVARQETFVRPSGANEDTQTIPINTLTADIGPGVDLDRSDNPLSPTRGYRVSASAFLATPYVDPFQETATFVLANLTATGYVPLGRGILAYAGLRYDQGFPIGAALLPKVERFFAGGDTTVRGFEQDLMKKEIVRTPVPPLPGLPGYQLIPIGGNIRVLQKFELIFPLWRNATVPINAALFLDTGLVTNSFDGLSLTDFRHSVGIAPLRLNTPVGFLSLEYAWPLDPETGDDPTGRFHINLGFGF